MGAILILSLTYVAYYVKRSMVESPEPDLTNFSNVRAIEIDEEYQSGRISQFEATQLKADLDTEVKLVEDGEGQTFAKKAFTSEQLPSQVFALILVFSTLGSVALYQFLGFSREVVFADQMKQGTITQEGMSDFLVFRAQKNKRAQDWFFVGQDKISQKDYIGAQYAFEQALINPPEDPQDVVIILTEYAQSVFFANQRKVIPKLVNIIDQILTIDANNSTALGLQGIVEFDRGAYKEAVIVWQRAIQFGASISEREGLLQGIEQAREIGAIGNDQVPSLVSHKIKLRFSILNPEKLAADAVFLVYAKMPMRPMPIAIKRLDKQAMLSEVELTNIDNLMPGMTLAQAEKVDLVVKLANSNDQDLTKGLEIAKLTDVLVNQNKVFHISIEL
jgi:cytochrome c-type biogenesis protein CcmH